MNGIVELDGPDSSLAQDTAAIVARLLVASAENPHDPEPLLQLGVYFAQAGRFREARAMFGRALQSDERSLEALWGLSDVEQALGDPAAALAAQQRVIAIAPVVAVAPHVHLGRIADRKISVLMLCVPGTFQANTPLEYIVNGAQVALHKWYLGANEIPPLPEYDVVFTAIGHDPTLDEVFAKAQEFVDRQTAPVINEPRLVQYLARDILSERFKASERIHVATVERISRTCLESRILNRRVLVRPISSQAGEHLALLRNEEERDAYLEKTPEVAEFYVMPFVDYRSDDGYYRKYRIQFIDGKAYPVHLAISPRWMVHYYNSSMAHHAWMRREEEAFLQDISHVFMGEFEQALHELAEALPFGYFAIDCGIAPDGRIILFEADTAMLVHMQDSEELFPYKRQYMERIVEAVSEMFATRLKNTNSNFVPVVAFNEDSESGELASSIGRERLSASGASFSAHF